MDHQLYYQFSYLDLEVQLCMTELIFRMLSPKMRESYAKLWFQQNPECYDDFMSIRDAEFESVRVSTLLIITHSNSSGKVENEKHCC